MYFYISDPDVMYSVRNGINAFTNRHNWVENLSLVLLVLRTSYRETINCLRADKVYGARLHLPGDFECQLSLNLNIDLITYIFK